MADLTENQKERISNIRVIQGSVSTLGAIGGAVYAHRTGGGFWRYLGYWIVGGLITGIPASIIATPFINKVLKDADKGSASKTTNVSNETKANDLLKQLNSLTMGGINIRLTAEAAKNQQKNIEDLEKLISDLGYILIPGNGGITGGFSYSLKAK